MNEPIKSNPPRYISGQLLPLDKDDDDDKSTPLWQWQRGRDPNAWGRVDPLGREWVSER